MTLSEHTAQQVEGLFEKAHAVLMRDFALPDFSFACDTQRVKILVVGVPLADTGSDSLWRLEDWTNDKVYDGLRTDLERSNPGIITVGRPNIIGSIHAIKASGATSCAIKFAVEKSAASDAALRSTCLCIRGGNRVCQLWTEHAPARVCNNCLTLGHISTLGASPPRCRLCRGNHATRAHLCQALNCCGEAGKVCKHTVRICLLYESSGHYTGHSGCPSLRMTPETAPPPLGGSPIEGAADSVAGATDLSVNRERNKRHRRNRPTPPGERQLNVATATKDVAADRNAKGKGKAVADYESATSPAPADSRVSASSELGFGKSTEIPVDDDNVFGSAGPIFNTAAPVPKRILRRPSSAPIDISSSSGASG